MERKNLTNSTINEIMKTMTDNEKKELEDKFNEYIKTLDVDFYYDPIKDVWVDLFRSITDLILFHITLKQTLKKVCNDESMSGDVVKEFIKTISKDW